MRLLVLLFLMFQIKASKAQEVITSKDSWLGKFSNLDVRRCIRNEDTVYVGSYRDPSYQYLNVLETWSVTKPELKELAAALKKLDSMKLEKNQSATMNISNGMTLIKTYAKLYGVYVLISHKEGKGTAVKEQNYRRLIDIIDEEE